MIIEGYYDSIDFFEDINDPSVIYAEVKVPAIGASKKAYKMFVPIDDRKLKSYIRQFILPNAPGYATVNTILEEAKDILSLGSNPNKAAPRIRTAGTLANHLMEYDLNNDAHEYVKITPSGWCITKNSKHKFLKRNAMGMQVSPKQTDHDLLSLLKPFLNTDRDGQIIFATWITQAYCMGNHSAMIIMSPQGSGKSTLTRMARSIVDPSRLDAVVMSQKKDDLFALLSNNYFVAFDNTDELSKDTSNILCSAITRATMAKRLLYTTNELGVYELHNTLVLNGLDIMPKESDLASRCLLLKLNSISPKARKPLAEIEANFAIALPEILGAIFNTLSKAMTIIENIHPQEMPRMADSYKEMLAIAIAMGISEQEFSRIYRENLAQIDKERSNIAIVEAICEYMTSSLVKGRAVEGTVSSLYSKIYSSYSGTKSNLPQAPHAFGKKLRQESRVLEAAGYTCNFDDTFADGTHLKIIKNK